jgi:hypothetical protein
MGAQKGPGGLDVVSKVFQMNGMNHLAPGTKGGGQRGKDRSDIIQGYMLKNTTRVNEIVLVGQCHMSKIDGSDIADFEITK